MADKTKYSRLDTDNFEDQDLNSGNYSLSVEQESLAQDEVLSDLEDSNTKSNNFFEQKEVESKTLAPEYQYQEVQSPEETPQKNYLQDHNTQSDPASGNFSQRRRDPAKKLQSQFETILVYGYILEAVAAFTCLLVLFNVVILATKIHKASAEESSIDSSSIVIRVFGAVAYGVTVYVGIVAQLVSLGFLYVMVRTRFKYNQAGVPKPDTTYANAILAAHVVIGLHWLGVALWLFLDPGYVDCFHVEGILNSSVVFITRVHRLCDLVWLVKFLSIVNFCIWCFLSFFLAIFVNHFYISFILKLFPFLRKYSLVNDLLHAVEYSTPSSSRQNSFYAPLSGY